MLKKILLDNQEFHFTKSHLPTLIHGEEHVGASLFTLTMLADLYTQGSKVIALTAYPMAIEEFDKQTGSDENMQFFTKEKIYFFLFVLGTSFFPLHLANGLFIANLYKPLSVPTHISFPSK